jgi:pimeloyl-ACP methyl ester carboxylesterase
LFAINADGHRLHYQQAGRGPDVVFVHGLAANLAFWHMRIAPALARDHRVTSFDLRGHGRSDMTEKGYTTRELASDLQCVLEAAGIGQADVVAHSYGGAVALEHALSWPDRVRSLSLVDARVPSLQPLHRPDESAYWATRRREIEALGIRVPEGAPRVVYRMLEELAPLAARGAEGPRVAPGLPLSNGLWNSSGRTARRWERLVTTTSFAAEVCRTAGLSPQRIRELREPVLLSYGGASFCLETCRRLQDLLRDTVTIVHPDLGHFFPVVQPELVVHDVRGFLAGLSRRAAPRHAGVARPARTLAESEA